MQPAFWPTKAQRQKAQSFYKYRQIGYKSHYFHIYSLAPEYLNRVREIVVADPRVGSVSVRSVEQR